MTVKELIDSLAAMVEAHPESSDYEVNFEDLTILSHIELDVDPYEMCTLVSIELDASSDEDMDAD
jgi:hypothetical protein